MHGSKSPILRELRREGKQAMIVDLLIDRFGTKAKKLWTRLNAIEDEARLLELNKLALTCPDLDSFREQLSP
jgi:hypothetical protein